MGIDDLGSSAERNEELDVYTTRVIPLIPNAKGGFDTYIQHKRADGKKPEKWEFPGGKVDPFNKKTNDNYSDNFNYSDKGGRYLKTGKNKIKQQEAIKEFQEETGIKISAADLIPIGNTKREMENGGMHNTQTYAVIIPSNTSFSPINDEEDKLDSGEFIEFLSANNELVQKKDGLKGLQQNWRVSNDETLKEVLGLHYQTDKQRERIENRLIYRVQNIRERLDVVFQNAATTTAFIDSIQKRAHLEAEDSRVKIEASEKSRNNIRNPNGTSVTLIDFLYDFEELKSEDKHLLLTKYIRNGDSQNTDRFFQDKNIKASILSLLIDENTFGKDIEKTKNYLDSISGYSSFEELILDGDQDSEKLLILALYLARKHLWNQGITTEKLADLKKDFSPLIDNMKDLSGVLEAGGRIKSEERILLKMLRKADMGYIPGDFLGGRIIVEESQQDAISESIKVQLANDSKITNLKVEKASEKNASYLSGKRGNEVKIEGLYKEIPFEIQINDANGYAKSEKDEQSHKIYELVQMLPVKFRLLDISKQFTKDQAEKWLLFQIQKNPEYISTDVDTVFKKAMERIDKIGFFREDNDEFIDYAQIFRKKHQLKNTEAGKEALLELYKHFSRLIQKINPHIDKNCIQHEDWEIIMDNPFEYFRNSSQKEMNKKKQKEVYKALVTIFLFNISGETEAFKIKLKNCNPEVFISIEQDYHHYQEIVSEFEYLGNKQASSLTDQEWGRIHVLQQEIKKYNIEYNIQGVEEDILDKEVQKSLSEGVIHGYETFLLENQLYDFSNPHQIFTSYFERKYPEKAFEELDNKQRFTVMSDIVAQIVYDFNQYQYNPEALENEQIKTYFTPFCINKDDLETKELRDNLISYLLGNKDNLVLYKGQEMYIQYLAEGSNDVLPGFLVKKLQEKKEEIEYKK